MTKENPMMDQDPSGSFVPSLPADQGASEAPRPGMTGAERPAALEHRDEQLLGRQIVKGDGRGNR